MLMTGLWTIGSILAIIVFAVGVVPFWMRRIKQLEDRVERLEAALLWTMTSDCNMMMFAYRVRRLAEILGLSKHDAESLLKHRMRNSCHGG